MTPQQLNAMKMALEALEKALHYHGVMLLSDPPQDAWKYHRVEQTAHEAITVIRKLWTEHAMRETQRLGQEIEQEPVAWVAEAVCDGQYIDGRPRKIWWECKKGVGTAFYTTPPQRKPLTDEQIFVIKHNWITTPFANHLDFARAIEAAHGIKENT